MHSISYSRPILMKIKFSHESFEKYSYIEFNKNPSTGSLLVLCRQTNRRTDVRTDGQTDRHKEPDCRCSLFCESTWKELALSIFLHTKIFWFHLHM